MKYRIPIAVSLCTLPLLVAWSLPRAAVRFAPDSGVALTKTFSYVLETEMNDMSTLVNGADPGMSPSVESSSTTTRTLSITDVYKEVEDGRPLKLVRTYDEISHVIDNPLSIEMMGESQEANMHGTGSSDLSGKSVVFAYDADAEEYSATFAEGEDGDDDALSELAEDLDLRALLPAGEVSEGDSWSIDIETIVDVLFPGGNIPIDVESDGDDSPMGAGDPFAIADPRMLFGEADGEATGTFAGMREVDDVMVAVIELEITVDSSVEMTEFLAETVAESGPEGMDIGLESADSEWTYEGSGELLWNTNGGFMHSLELEGEVETVHEQEMSLDMGGQSMSIEQTIEESGTFKHSASATAAKN